MSASLFAPLPEGWEPTRATLHAYAHAVGVLPRALAIAHPKWWHVSLNVRPTGLVTDTMAIPGGGTFNVRIDPRRHAVVLETSAGESTSWSMADGMTGTEMGDALVAAARDLEADAEFNRDKYTNDEARDYDADHASTFFGAFVNIDHVLERHRATLEGDFGPLQLWPHGFDLAMEWFGTRVEKYEEDGEVTEYPSQLNLGFYPGGRAYFYSNPWPFEESLAQTALPVGDWHTEGWQGSILHYDEVAGSPDAADQVLAFAKAVHEAASPTLLT